MKISLYQKLSISLLAIFLLVIVAIVFITQSFEAISRDKAEQELHQSLAAHLVHDNPLLSEGEHDHEALQNLFHSMMILGPNFEFYILDTNGKILSYSAKPGEVVRQSVNLEPINWLYTNQMSYPIYADDPRSDQKKIFSTAPILTNGKIRGHLFVIIGGQIYDSIFNNIKNNESVQLIGVIAISSLVFLLLILLVSFHFFVRPLKRLSIEVKNLSDSGFDKQLLPIDEVSKGLEVSELSIAFNQLISQVNLQFKQLESVDSERRELLAHLSHDLRTPLASLQGFLQTIQLKQGTLPPQEINTYIARCLKSSRSINGFVNQIFELAHLESGQVSISLEKFPIAELLYDTIEKFSISAEKKNITIALEIANEKQLVTTDIAKLERIMSNLIENAIRHTPKNGNIWINVHFHNKDNQFQLTIKDSGTGINQDELPYLFDARYRGKQAVDDGDRHIGLGLTITKKLVTLLGSDIKAGNNPEGGANFQFGLPSIG